MSEKRIAELEEQLEAAHEEILFLCSDEDDIRKGLREQLTTYEQALREIADGLGLDFFDAPEIARRALEGLTESVQTPSEPKA